MVQEGLVSQTEITQAAQMRVNPSDPSSSTAPRNPPVISTNTEGVESLTDFPATLQLSRSFTLGQVTMSPWIQPASHVHPIPAGGYGGQTKGQIIANLKLCAINILDPIKDRYPDMFLTSTWRPDTGNPRSQHMKGQACDMQFRNVPKSRYYDIAVWIRDNLQFDQLLLEYTSSPTCWIHCSFNGAGNRPNGPFKVGTMLNHSFTNRDGLTNLAGQIGLG